MEESTQVEAQTVQTEGSEATTVDQSTGESTETSYANGKFKAVSELEKGYLELQKSYSQKLGKFDGAPEEYSLNEGFESVGTAETLMAWGKENQLSNDGLNSLIAKMTEAETASVSAYKTQQMEALGKDATTRIANATDWVRANLGEDAVEGINSMWVGAKGIEAIEKIMKLSQGTAPTVAPARPAVDADSLRAMRFAKDEFGNRRMETDPAFRQKVLEAEASLRGTEFSYVVNN